MTDPVPQASAHAPRVVLISTYDLGHQPFGLASPAAWLRAEGAEVTCLDLAVGPLSEPAVRDADMVALFAPMHTATRMVTAVLPRIRQLNPAAHVCVYGLYAPMNADHLLECGADSIIGGEFEEPLRQLLRGLRPGRRPVSAAGPPAISLERQQFVVPDRGGLPALAEYAGLELPDGQRKVSGYTEATRGCKHLCRHYSWTLTQAWDRRRGKQVCKPLYLDPRRNREHNARGLGVGLSWPSLEAASHDMSALRLRPRPTPVHSLHPRAVDA